MFKCVCVCGGGRLSGGSTLNVGSRIRSLARARRRKGVGEQWRARLQPADWPKGFTLKTSLREGEREAAAGGGGEMANDREKEK